MRIADTPPIDRLIITSIMMYISILLLLQAVSFGLAFRIGGHINRLGAGVGGTSPQLQNIIKSTADQYQLGVNSARRRRSSALKMSQNISYNNNQHKRRSFIQNLLAQSIVFSSVVASSGASAEAALSDAKITHKVYFDVRISRADGTFYVRDDTEPDNEPFYGQLVFGLFGNATPNHAKEFLSFVEVPYEVDNPLPSYSKSKFPTIDTSTGLLIGGTVSNNNIISP